ncbi:hypothetical protein [Candidatus Bodocaedibacter vickermanii]|uniref:ATP-binding protein n=1 Tax=Candidatus Bodocaedibacter vickermanii TaxID=2741701 RepID=A0A7L9RV20_9PROT|nr:ATP-binding protein [Candidatus Paracaedibacteraceae bacterium 'Lake Konstanz']
MTHTFKSLLITTVLTLPSAFGAAELHVTAAAAGPHSAEIAAVAVARHLVATPEGMRRKVDQLVRSGQKEKAVELLEEFANHPDATLKDIRSAGWSISILGGGDEKAVVLFERAANHPDATPEYIFDAASGMYDLGPSFYLRVAELLEKSANLPDAAPVDIQNAAYGLYSLGVDFYARAAELFEKSATHPDATPDDIQSAAYGSWQLGQKDKAAELFEKSANLPDVTPVNIQNAVRGLRSIAAKCREGSAERARYNALADAIAAR